MADRAPAPGGSVRGEWRRRYPSHRRARSPRPGRRDGRCSNTRPFPSPCRRFAGRAGTWVRSYSPSTDHTWRVSCRRVVAASLRLCWRDGRFVPSPLSRVFPFSRPLSPVHRVRDANVCYSTPYHDAATRVRTAHPGAPDDASYSADTFRSGRIRPRRTRIRRRNAAEYRHRPGHRSHRGRRPTGSPGALGGRLYDHVDTEALDRPATDGVGEVTLVLAGAAGTPSTVARTVGSSFGNRGKTPRPGGMPSPAPAPSLSPRPDVVRTESAAIASARTRTVRPLERGTRTRRGDSAW